LSRAVVAEAILFPLSGGYTVRLSVLQENLAKGLAIVGRAVSPRSSLPVLGNILLASDEGRLKLAATNLEIGVSCWLGAQVQDEGSITVPARLLTDWTGLLPPERIDMEMVVRTMSLNLKCARFESNIKGIDANEFPLSRRRTERRHCGCRLLPCAT
jgi:DNA polymerase III subunit beta